MLATNTVLLLGIVVRVALLGYGTWADANMRVKFTDVDYNVLSDGAHFVLQGASPYDRETYRYTPLLAMLLTPNEWTHGMFGKLCFVVADLLACVLIQKLLEIRKVDKASIPWLVALWALNPMVFAISTRGNAESLVALFVLLTLYGLHTDAIVLAAVSFGLAVHIKPFPILYALPMYFFIETPQGGDGLLQRLFALKRVKFALVSGGTFLALGAAMYHLYGWEFIEQTYLYHVVRKDHRHNFSVYFYLIYLNFFEAESTAVAILSFLPQLLVLVLIGWAFHKDISFCCFAQTFAFVTFNKVCTSQYFIWYITFVPLLVPFSTMPFLWRGLGLLGLWIVSQALWLNFAYNLEFLGLDTFAQLWYSSALFFAVNILILSAVILHQRITPHHHHHHHPKSKAKTE